jgi:WXG100 family type VII secretion target
MRSAHDLAADDFAVDAEELHRVIGELSSCESDLRGLAADLAKQIKVLHSTWQGQAAMAHRLAQSEWELGFLGMRDALADLRAAAQLAHHNYESATNANLEMWSQLG